MSHRLAQVNELLRHELGILIPRELETPNCLVTITAVHTSPDLAEATVTITVIPANYTGSTLEKINKRATMLHSLLNKRVQMRKTPKLHFVLDTVERRAQNVEYTLDSLRDEHATPHPTTNKSA